ncbi:hypothetical protein [Blautia sp.]|uniref:hypothetical protein n=1 Tax=Blautia sp. TaxID=1955243 RepID=UPI002605973A|nr:hypothetical protein [Blautia sp.]
MQVSFENQENDFIRCTGLTQWDYGQELEITGLPDVKNAELHYCLEGDAEAEIMPASITGEKITAPIPDELLKKGRNICAYLYLATREKGETIKTIFLSVRRRARPNDYSAPPEKNLLRQLMEELGKKADNAKIIDGAFQLLSGEKEIGDRIRLPSGGGGREVELRNNGTTIQWRYTDSNEWHDLITVEELKGKDGVTPDFEIRDGHLFAIYET